MQVKQEGCKYLQRRRCCTRTKPCSMCECSSLPTLPASFGEQSMTLFCLLARSFSLSHRFRSHECEFMKKRKIESNTSLSFAQVTRHSTAQHSTF